MIARLGRSGGVQAPIMWAWLGAVLALGAAPAGAAPQAVATVAGKALTQAEVQKAADELGPRGAMVLANPATRRQLVERMIDTALLSASGEARGLDKTPEFAALLSAARAQILATLYSKAYIAEHTTEPQLRAYFDKDPTRFSAKEIKVSHIILATEAEARAVLVEARAPDADFQALAKRRSVGPSGGKGGELGYFRRGSMVPAFEAAAFATPKGQIYPQPVKTQFGYHVIKVVDVRGDDTVPFATVKDRVREQLERELRDDLLTDLRHKAKVAVHEDALKNWPL
jgi:peptidyl-prolyl cis-trans isomerase C